MKQFITLIAVTMSLALGACCTTGGSCPLSGKKKECCPTTQKECCAKKTCTKEGGCKHKH